MAVELEDERNITAHPEIRKSDIRTGEVIWALGATTIVAVSAFGVINMSALDKQHTPYDKNIYPEVSSVTIENGAELLSDPPTDSSKNGYVLYKLNLDGTAKKIDVSTPGGVSEVFFKGHKFIGIPITDLLPELQTKVKDDSDGKVWFDDQDNSEKQ